jgi:hypothetical protein
MPHAMDTIGVVRRAKVPYSRAAPTVASEGRRAKLAASPMSARSDVSLWGTVSPSGSTAILAAVADRIRKRTVVRGHCVARRTPLRRIELNYEL